VRSGIDIGVDSVDDYGFQLLRERIKRDTNFNAPCYEEKHLKRRLAVRMRALNISTYQEYLGFLSKKREEYHRLLRALTINVTRFFRDRTTYDAIFTQVYPRLASSKRHIRIWSSGCSDGKEPYSLAILLLEFLDERINSYSPIIYASDIDDEILEKAKKGVYREQDVQDLDPRYLLKYFDKYSDGFRLKKKVRDLVRFQHRDLISDPMPKCIDLILCRNVVIYFAKDVKEKIYLNFYNALNPGGFLVLGKTETLLGEARDRFKLFNNIERIYVK
jgi:chemotaxis protein methyltransferase CheR